MQQVLQVGSWFLSPSASPNILISCLFYLPAHRIPLKVNEGSSKAGESPTPAILFANELLAPRKL